VLVGEDGTQKTGHRGGGWVCVQVPPEDERTDESFHWKIRTGERSK
jgi:hypothetical protein